DRHRDAARAAARARARASRRSESRAPAVAFRRHEQSVVVGRVPRAAHRGGLRRRRGDHRDARPLRLSRRASRPHARVGDPAPRHRRGARYGEQAVFSDHRAPPGPRALPRGQQRRVDAPRRRPRADGPSRDLRRRRPRRGAGRGDDAPSARDRCRRRLSAGRHQAGARVGGVGAVPRARVGGHLRPGGRMTRPVRLTVVLTHPIQYYAPWLRHIHEHAPEIALTVVYAVRPTAEQQGVGFDRAFEWDVPLTGGYRSIVVREARAGERIDSDSFRGVDVPEIGDVIASTTPDVVMITGWYSKTLVRALAACRRLGVPALY